MTISEQDAISIDKCESSILRTAYPTIRDAISKHLTEISKKSRKKNSEEEVIANPHPYQVDVEVGRFIFTSESLYGETILAYEMTWKASIDIDDFLDLKICEMIMKKSITP